MRVRAQSLSSCRRQVELRLFEACQALIRHRLHAPKFASLSSLVSISIEAATISPQSLPGCDKPTLHGKNFEALSMQYFILLL